MIINKGEADGVHKNAAVLSPLGVVGQIMTTGAHSARVLLITDHNSGVDAVVQRSRARGIVEGALDGGCVMKYLKRGEDVEVGDRIVTSGLDGIFPKGIMIGEVTRVMRGNRGLLQVAEVKPDAKWAGSDRDRSAVRALRRPTRPSVQLLKRTPFALGPRSRDRAHSRAVPHR